MNFLYQPLLYFMMVSTESQTGSADENKRIFRYFLPNCPAYKKKKAFLNKVLGEKIHWRGSEEMGKKIEYITVFFYGQT